MNYDSENVGKLYDEARPLPTETVELWLRAITESIGSRSVVRIVDVGCGTGRFTQSLSDWFNAEVVGIDPSRSMLSQAIGKGPNRSISFCEGCAERIPMPDSSTDLIFLSMVYHHISNKSEAIREFGRVLRSGGVVCIRNSTTNLIDDIPYIAHFPAAQEYVLRNVPGRDDMIRMMESGGLLLLKHEVLKQQFAASPSEYLRKIRMRGLSDLAAISDVEFEAGLARLEASSTGVGGPVKESIDLLIFEKRPNTAMESEA